jgi:regulation of enolase protein 1 (concanavalin A-like superfamily)
VRSQTGYVARQSLCAALLVALMSSLAGAQPLPAPWASADIGAPNLSGSAIYNSDVFTIDAGGSGLGGRTRAGPTDQIHFVSQTITGDVDVVARVEGLTSRGAWTEAGVMIRNSLAANSAHATAEVTAGRGVQFARRPGDGGATAHSAHSAHSAGPVPTAPVWLRAVRVGTRVTAYSSTDGTTWTTLGSETIALGSTVYVGIAVSSHNPDYRTTAPISNLRVTQTGLPSGQRAMDIGSPAIYGSTAYSNGTYTIRAAGADIWDTADQFRFVYQTMTGDGEVVARVNSITQAHEWSKAGVMIRESLAADSRHALMAAAAARGYAFQRRPDTAGSSVHTAGTLAAPPGWVRLARTGNLFKGYQSADGVTWVPIGSETILMGETVYVGLAVTSHNVGATTTASISGVRVTSQQSLNQPPAVSIMSPAFSARYMAPTSVNIAADAADPEGRLLSVDFYVDSTLMSRDTSAPYAASWPVTAAGTYSLTAVAHDQDGGSTTSAAVSITARTNTAYDVAGASTTSVPATVTVSGSSGGLPAGQQSRDIGSPDVAGSAAFVNGAYTITAGGSDIWRASDEFHFVYQQVTADTELIARVASIGQTHEWSKAGVMVRETLAADSANVSMLLTAGKGYSFQERSTAGAHTAATFGSTDAAPGWVRVVRRGNLFVAYESANGSNWVLVDSDTVPMSATVYVGLAVTSHDVSAATTVLIDNFRVVASGANQPPTVSMTSPTSAATFTAPATINLAANASDPENRLARVEFFNGTNLLASDTTAPYAFAWTDVAAGTYTLTATAYDSDGAVATSTAVTVTVTSSNGAPTVALTSPASGASFSAPATINMTASASDPENQMARVEFYNGLTLLFSVTTAPYAWSWTNVAAGTYTLTAVAVDAAGNRTTSTAASVTVGTTALTPPRLVVFTASTDHETNVNSYRLDVFTSSANPATATPVATANLGKPTPDANNDITSDQSTLFSNLRVGNYIATVTAIGPGGSTRSATVSFTR